MNIGERIKSLRDQKNVTQTELAEMIGTTKQNIYKYENGIITNIPSDKIELMAQYFNVSPAYIMGWDDKPSFPPEPKTYRAKKGYIIKKIAPDEVKDDIKEQKAIDSMTTEELLALLDEVSQALKDKQHNPAE